MSKDLKIFTENIEQSAIDQIDLLLEQEAFKDCKIRIMPDVHAGAGCVIGFTGNLGDKVIPNIVGVDIGCGMLCMKLGKFEVDLQKFDELVHQIPSGMNAYELPLDEYSNIYNKIYDLKCFNKLKNINYLQCSLGTLGGGNHFIELDKDDENNIYLVIHSGSRNLGKQVAEIYQNIAIENCSYKNELQEQIKLVVSECKAKGTPQEIEPRLKALYTFYGNKTKLPKDLCYLEGQDREDYLHDMKICQEFAHWNRMIMGLFILEHYYNYANNYEPYAELDYFESVHNYISFKDNIVRKGAISARKFEQVIIPINMRDGCILGIGRDNEDWNYSAPHGAGRIMSRRMAKDNLKIEDFKDTMKDIYSTTVNENTIDEAPMVYKPIEEIIKNIENTVEIIKIIKPIYNFKASEDNERYDKETSDDKK